jgi:hypothetical protein
MLQLAIETERQRRYNDAIRDKRAVISSLTSTGLWTVLCL